MYINNMTDLSPTRVFTTSEALTGGAFTAVTLGENGVKTAGANDIPIGILAAETELPQGAGEDVNVQICGGTLWTAGEAVKAGDFLSAGEGGKAFKTGEGGYIFGQALENAAANNTVRALIIHGGKA